MLFLLLLFFITKTYKNKQKQTKHNKNLPPPSHLSSGLISSHSISSFPHFSSVVLHLISSHLIYHLIISCHVMSSHLIFSSSFLCIRASPAACAARKFFIFFIEILAFWPPVLRLILSSFFAHLRGTWGMRGSEIMRGLEILHFLIEILASVPPY